VASLLAAETHHWHIVFVIVAVMNIVAALLAIVVLRPWRIAGAARGIAA
jgi:hypothetical protein